LMALIIISTLAVTMSRDVSDGQPHGLTDLTFDNLTPQIGVSTYALRLLPSL
jgi:hypothetical protein